mgnify:CR=1 FL=1
MTRIAAFIGGAAATALAIYLAWTIVEHQRNFDNQESAA